MASPFEPNPLLQSERQYAYDVRRRHYLECLPWRAYLKADRFQEWLEIDAKANPVEKPGGPPGTRYGERHITLCDIVQDIGLDALDPGLLSIREEWRWLPPDEQARRLRARLLAEDRLEKLVRTLLVRADPEQANELFAWHKVELDPETYWADKLASVHMRYLLDTADFGANEFLRILYMLGEIPPSLREAARAWRGDGLDRDLNFPASGEATLARLFQEFKYWIDDPFRCDEFSGRTADIRAQKDDDARLINPHEKMDAGQDMTYWSENHRILFATAEYLAGQWWPDAQFVSARTFRKEGPDAPPRPGDLTGREHAARGRVRIRAWLDERLRLGFAEWNAPGYYVEDVVPLINLADFSADEDIRSRAAMVLDLLVFDLALASEGGAFAGAAGRAYFEHKNCVWEQSIRDASEVLFGRRGHFVGSGLASIFLATSPCYRPPDALLAIGTEQTPYTGRSRVSINFEEAAENGIGFSTPDDMMFWWSRAAYATKQTIEGSRRVAKDAGLMETPPFREVVKPLGSAGDALSGLAGREAYSVAAAGMMGLAIGGPAGFLGGAALGSLAGLFLPGPDASDLADLASIFTEGSVLSRANLFTHRIDNAQLSSVQRFRTGQLNFQGLPCVASTGSGAMVWTSYPSAGSRLKLDVSLAPVRGGLGALVGGLALGPVGAVAGYLLAAKQSSPIGGLGIKDIYIDEDILPASHDGPNWWTGNVVQPFVVQRDGTAIIAYQANTIQKLLFGQRTHAWFPRSQFDETRGPFTAVHCNHDTARWFFGRSGEGYVALFSAREAEWGNSGPWEDKEIRAEGEPNVFILQVGNSGLFGSFDGFITQVLRARTHVSGLHNAFGSLECSYDVPSGSRLELHYDDREARYGGAPLALDRYARFANPFARVEWRQSRYAIQHAGQSLIHDINAGTRTLGGVLDSLDHAAPLSILSQNMGLLPWPFYKGIDRDRALDHLVEILRERQPDVVGLSEMWVESEREELRSRLGYLYPYTIDGPHEDDAVPLLDVELSSGGLMILSRHSILVQEQSIFRACSGDDCLANKGILHIRIVPPGSPCGIDVFLSHTQAPEPTIGGSISGARTAVEAQIRHLSSFIASARDPLVPAILLGDLNIDSFAHPDLYKTLVDALGNPVDLVPAVAGGARYVRPNATSESDHQQFSSFHPSHPSRPADDPGRFGSSCERLDYLLAFPGLLYRWPQAAKAEVLVEQWTPGRDMSDHYGVTATFDTIRQELPTSTEIVGVELRLITVHCLQTTSGPGDDEVSFTLAAYADLGGTASGTTKRVEDVSKGSICTLDGGAISVGRPSGGLFLVLAGLEKDDLSADDSLGIVSMSLDRDTLFALAGMPSHTFAFPRLTGDEGEYVVTVAIEVRV